MLLCLVSSFHNALLTSPAAPVIEAFAKLGQGAWSEGRHLQKAVYDDVIGEVQRCQAAAESLRVRRAEMQAKRDRFVEVTAVKGSFASRIQQGWKAALAIVTGAALVALLAGAPLWTVMLVCLSLGALAGVGIWYHWRVLDQTRANVGCELGDLIGVPSEAGVSVEVAAEKAIERLDEEIAERQRALGLYQTTAGKLASLFTPDTTA
jgi:cytochrome c-type biogenesis protein CcmH/NrfG